MEISCIIVNYNNAKFVAQAIQSVLNQTRVPDEIIIADDASTDDSPEIIKKLAAVDVRIRPIFRDQNLGVSKNRDLAIKQASGKYITTLDGDDWYYPEKIEREYEVVKQGKNIIACSDIEMFGEEGILDFIKVAPFCKLDNSYDWIRFLGARKRGIPRDMMMPKCLYQEVNGLRHSLKRYEDWDLDFRLTNTGALWRYSGTKGTAYRRVGSGLSSVSLVRHLFAELAVLFSVFFKLRMKMKMALFFGALELLLIKGPLRSFYPSSLIKIRKMRDVFAKVASKDISGLGGHNGTS